jgi:hypothetical protein
MATILTMAAINAARRAFIVKVQRDPATHAVAVVSFATGLPVTISPAWSFVTTNGLAKGLFAKGSFVAKASSVSMSGVALPPQVTPETVGLAAFLAVHPMTRIEPDMDAAEATRRSAIVTDVLAAFGIAS